MSMQTPPPPPDYWPPQGPPRSSNAVWWYLGGAAALAALLVVALVAISRPDNTDTHASHPTITTTEATATTSATGPNITITVYSPEALLASADEVGEVMGAAMTAGPVMNLPASDGGVDPAECTGTYGPGTAEAYRDSGYDKLAGQILRDTAAPPPGSEVIQVVLTFPTPEDAEDFADGQSDHWADCNGVQASVQYTGSPDVVSSTIGETSTSDGILHLTTTPVAPLGPQSRQCQRALSTVHNAVIDLRACATTINNQAVELVQQIRKSAS